MTSICTCNYFGTPINVLVTLPTKSPDPPSGLLSVPCTHVNGGRKHNNDGFRPPY